MGMPRDLLLIRHGESEGNVALNASKAGDDHHITEGFLAQHSSHWRLSPKGREQAVSTGEWLREHFPEGFDRYYTSEYTRAMETAALLDLPGADWMISPYLRERWWGDLDRMSHEERQVAFAQSLHDRDVAPYYWRPPNGESLVEVCARLRPILSALHRECDGKQVVIVCHGEVMEAFLIELLRMTQHAYLARELRKDVDPSLKIRNCQIFQFTRRPDPDDEAWTVADGLAERAEWFRSFRPCDNFEGRWEQIERPRYGNEALLEIVGSSPVLLEY